MDTPRPRLHLFTKQHLILMSALICSVGKPLGHMSFAHTADECKQQLTVFCKQIKFGRTSDGLKKLRKMNGDFTSLHSP